MAELKTRPNYESVEVFLDSIPDDRRRQDGRAILKLMKEITGEEPQMWGSSIVGFGNYHYRYASGREGDWFKTGFSPRKQSLTLYIMSGFEGHEDLLARLGRHKTGKGCLYVNRLEDVDQEVLRELIRRSIQQPMGQEGQP
jgi:hypothetical protein